MTYFTIYLFALVFGTVLCAAAALSLWRRREMPGGIPLSFSLWGAALWCAAASLEALSVDVPTKVFWSKIEYLGAATLGTLFFLFAREFTRAGHHHTRRWILFLSLEPVLSLALAFTNEWHGWLWTSYHLDASGGIPILIYGHGTWFYVHAAYNFVLLFASCLLLARYTYRAPRLHRLQAATLLVGACAPLASSLLYVWGWSPLRGLDWSPFPFVVTGSALTWSILRYHLLEIVPIARDTLIENMKDGVLVLDSRDRVMDFNRAATRMLQDRVSLGQPLDPPTAISLSQTEHRGALSPARAVETSDTALYDPYGNLSGHLIVLHDITERRRLEIALREANATLEKSVAERTAELAATVTRLEAEIAERRRVEATLRRMEETLAQRVADQSRSLSALYELILFAGQPLSVAQIQEQALATILSVMGSSAGCIHQWDERTQTLRLLVHSGMSPAAQRQLATLPAGWMLSDRIPRAVTDLHRDPSVPDALRLAECQSYLGVPVYLLGRPIGSVGLFWQDARSLAVEEIALFGAMADQLGIIVENVRLRERGEAAAALNERRKLARDLHDSVTQSLHSLALSTDTARHRLSQGKLDRLEVSLEHLAESARQALKEMRLLLFEMRLAPLAQVNLVEALALRLDAVEKRAGIDTTFVAENLTDLPKAWEEELYCIAMEALNNSLKHARANHVEVRLCGHPFGFELQVADDGRGIPPGASRPGGMGLHSMAERADRIGGQFSLVSTPGKGTRVSVRVDKPSPASPT